MVHAQMMSPKWLNERASMASWAMAMSHFLSWPVRSVSMILWAIPVTVPYLSSMQSPSLVHRTQLSLTCLYMMTAAAFRNRSH